MNTVSADRFDTSTDRGATAPRGAAILHGHVYYEIVAKFCVYFFVVKPSIYKTLNMATISTTVAA